MAGNIILQGVLEKMDPDAVYIVINPQDRDKAIALIQDKIDVVCQKADANDGVYDKKKIDVNAYRQADLHLYEIADAKGGVKALAIASSDPKASFNYNIYEALFHKSVRQVIATNRDWEWSNAQSVAEILGHAGFLEKTPPVAAARPAPRTLLSRLAAITGYGQPEEKRV